MATGGEFASATAFLVESAPAGRRGFFGSLQMVGQSLAALAGALVGMLITQGLTPEQVLRVGRGWHHHVLRSVDLHAYLR